MLVIIRVRLCVVTEVGAFTLYLLHGVLVGERLHTKLFLYIHSRTPIVPSLSPCLPPAASGRGIRDRAVLLWHPGVRECSQVLPGQL